MTSRRRRAWLLVALGALALAPLSHLAVGLACRIDPPRIAQPNATGGWTRVIGGVRVARLEGSAEEIGAQHATLLRERMLPDELEIWRGFEDAVPSALARLALVDIGRARYRAVDRGIPEARRRELAAEALAFAPDPYADRLATYNRMVLFYALYDIALSFERSPLVGCSTFGLGPSATLDGHALVARAFDFEAAEVFDRDKVLFLVRESGAIPFASVGWPGFVGVVTGMNAEGVFVAVHGGRAREPQTAGIPVVFSLRETLGRARDTDEAVETLSRQQVMVSHIVFVADAKGRFAVVERAPGSPATARRDHADPERVAVTNHFEGPLRDDPRNLDVRARTSTLARRSRLDELLALVGARSATPSRAVEMLRDHACAKGASCELGDRRAIDAFIATHGVVGDTTDRVLWVSAGPHLSGRFVRFDLKRLLDPAATAPPQAADVPDAIITDDPVLHDGRYELGRARAVARRNERGGGS